MKNKTILLLALILCVFIQVNAQVSIVPRVGANLAWCTGHDTDIDSEALLFPQAGATVHIGLNDKLALQPGLIYSKKGEKEIYYNKDYYWENVYYHYLEIPVNLVYSFKLWNKNFQVFGGSYLGYCFKGKMETKGGSFFPLIIGYSHYDHIRTFDFGYSAGIGYRFKKMQIQAGYEGSFFSIRNFYETKNNSVISLTLGYFIDLKKKEK